jgi:hypothetical protein
MAGSRPRRWLKHLVTYAHAAEIRWKHGAPSIADQKPGQYGFVEFVPRQCNQGAYVMKMRTLAAATAVFTLGAGIIVPAVVHAEQDFTRYTNEELVQQRTQTRDMSEGDRTRYQEEMRKREQTMSAQERKRLGVDAGDQQAQGDQTRQRTRTSEDNTNGQGEMQRERVRSESGNGYGSGYESRQSGSRSAGGMGGRGAGGGGGGRGR